MIGSLADGRFNVLKRLDSGAQPATHVYLVEDTKDRRERRLLRLLAPVRDAGERKQAHFQRELEALAGLQHPNLQKIIAFGTTEVTLPGTTGTHLYIAGEHVDGPDILRFAARSSWSLFMEIAVQALRGLEFLHGQGLLHGALTPENVVIAGRGPRKTAKLLHFGLAAKGLLDPFANARFLAPEVLGGETADRRADLYSLGAVLYEAATRQPILAGKTREELRAAKAPPAPRELKKAIPKAVEDLILTLTARDPAGRPASANAVIRELNKTAHKRFSVETKEAKVAAILTPRFLGRDDELADLEAISGRVLSEAESHEQDDPVLVALSGEAGVGKTRLLRELKGRLHARSGAAGAPQARKDAAVFVEARAAEGAPSPILELVRGAIAAAGEDREGDLERLAAPLGRLRPDLGLTPPSPLAPEDERLRVVDAAVRTLLACARVRPLVLVLEDAHDADALSLDALRLLVHDVRAARTRRAGQEPLEETAPPPEDAPVLVLVSLCDDELPGRPVERAVRDLLQQDGVREVALERLSRETIEQLAASALGRELGQVRALVSRVADEADGSPLVAEEILATLADDGKLPPPDGAFKLDPAAIEALEVPGDLDELARRRLSRLPDDARALVHALALSPAPREAHALAQALELDDAEVLALGRELERRRLSGPPVRTGDDEDSPWRLSLESAALRDAALADLGTDEVEAIEDALGRALATEAATAEEDGDEGVAYLAAEDAARHLLRGSRRTSGVPFALAVAGWLAQAAVPERADDLLSRALAALEEAGRLGEVQPGEPVDAARVLEDVPAPAVVKQVAASDLELALLLERGDVLLRSGRPQDARTELERALGIARTRRKPREAVTALLGAGRAAQALGDRVKARARFEEALGLARDVDWPRGIALAQRELGLARLELGDIEDAVLALEAAVRLEEERQDKVALAQALRDLARALEEKGDLEAALERATRARDLDEENERPSGVSAAYRRLASVHIQKGDHARALELARRAIALAREAGDPRGARVALTAVAQVLATRGENDEAIARYEAALRLALRSADAEGAAATRALLARVLEARGRFDEAHDHLEAAIKLFSQQKRRTAAARAIIHLAQSHLRRGDVTRARDAVERATQEMTGPAAGPASGDGRESAPQGQTPVALEALHLRSEIAFRQGDLARAEELAREAADTAARTAQKRIEATARVTLGAVRLRRGRLAEAEKEHREARALAQALGDRSLEARARLALARVHLVRAEPVGALEEFEAARDMAQNLGEVDLEVRSLLGLARLHVFLGQPRRAEQILEPARQRVQDVGLGLVRPEVTLAKVEASQDSRLMDGKTDAKAGSPRAQELAQVDALLEEADRDARATSRRGLRAEVDLARAREELIRGNATAARERAEAALEAARIAGDVLLATSAELTVAEARLAGNRVEDARAAADRAIAEAEQGGLVEAKSHALLLRARTLAAEAPRAAAKDLREAASLVRAAWAALPENLREAYGRKPLARAIRLAADEVVSRTAAANPRASAVAVAEPAAAGARASAVPAGTTVARAGASAPVPADRTAAGAAPARPAAVTAPPREDGEGAAGTPGQVSLDTLKDPLTGLYNHTYFTAQLEVEIKRSQRHSRPLSLLKINIDRFKLVRELYGPRTGKRIIREVAAVLVRNLRDVDVIARYFGDEFEALLPDTPAAGSVLTADRLRTAIEGTAFAHEGEKVDLTISVGVATFPADAKDKDALTCRVDEALYNARARGPNKTFGFSTKEDAKDAGPEANDKDLREIDSLMLSREGRLVLSVVNRVVHSEMDLDRLIAFTTGMVVDATRGERGFFLLRGRDGELHFKHGRNIDDKELQNPEFKISHGIAREVARTGESIIVEEALDDGRFRDFKSVMDLRLRSILCAPIKTTNDRGQSEVLGVIYVDHNSIARHFTKEDLHFLEAITSKISIPLKNSKNLRDAEEQLAEVHAKLKSSQDQLETKYRYDKIIGATEPMQRIFKLLDRIVETHHAVVIHGESGTGKELIARAIHYNGARKNKPFVAENCAALTDTLLEAELFGHVKGAFTGADKDAKGLFELANGGTLFLDEIGDMSERMQKKLLRVLQEGEVRPVGGKKIIRVDVRIISASNKDLKKLVQERKFREDLYYRLNVITVNLPALRERREDVPLLVEHFLKKVSGDPPKPMEREVMRLLCAYDWPGNVRELENEINRMVAMSDTTVDVNALSPKIREGATRADPAKIKEDGLAKYYDRPLKEVEFEVMKDIILRTLERTNWHRTKAAKILRVPTSTLFNKMKKYGIG